MFKRLMGCFTCAVLSHAAAAEPPGQTITRAGSVRSTPGPASFFTGDVSVTPAFSATSEIHASGAHVAFTAGARSAWHTHPAGQHLIVTEGVGRVQEWGRPVQEIKAGDVIWCPPGVKHWHGASPGTAMTHLAITGFLGEKNVEWLEKVTDEQYRAG